MPGGDGGTLIGVPTFKMSFRIDRRGTPILVGIPLFLTLLARA
jgi:hypothetical protein